LDGLGNMNASAIVKFRDQVVESVSKTIVGKRDVIELVTYDLLVGGHILFEDFPGLGKTTLAKAVAKAIGCEFKRIQCTADMLPADITGTYVLDPPKGFRFLKGPVFTQILLADEINRSPPKTQSALLEAMQERQVTAENQTFPLPEPFVVFATQNPIEYEGTYPLPEAQMDRFSVRLRMGYPGHDEEVEILGLRKSPTEELKAVVRVSGPEELVALQSELESVYVDEDLKTYVVRIASKTRSIPGVEVGVSPRGSIQLFRLCRARAACLGRDYVTPDDVKALAAPALAHRLVLNTDYAMKGLRQETIVEKVLAETPVPKVSEPER
jgi:MoxR-like ATPase